MMARKPKSVVPPVPAHVGKYYLDPKAEWGGFINIKVEDSQKNDFDNWWSTNRTYCWSALDDLMGEGMKVSLAYDQENECYICSFTGKGWDTSYSRWCMSTRAGTLDESIALAVWKHFVLADCEWGDFLPKTGKKKMWG